MLTVLRLNRFCFEKRPPEMLRYFTVETLSEFGRVWDLGVTRRDDLLDTMGAVAFFSVDEFYLFLCFDSLFLLNFWLICLRRLCFKLPFESKASSSRLICDGDMVWLFLQARWKVLSRSLVSCLSCWRI